MPAELRFGLHLPTAGAFADVRMLVDLAQEAEAHGWDGFFIFDQVLTDPPEPLADPVVALTALALGTTRLRLGALVTPLPRRRPWKVARELATLDQVSGGRMVLGVGSGGGATEFDDVGEAADARTRAEQLDDSLAVIASLWRGEPFTHTGRHHTVRVVGFEPRPRVPIWVGGIWPHRAPIERAARWDGVFPHFVGGMLPTDELRRVLEVVRAARSSTAPFDVIVRNKTGVCAGPTYRDLTAAYAAAGATWWLEGVESAPAPEQVRELIRRGPPTAAR